VRARGVPALRRALLLAALARRPTSQVLAREARRDVVDAEDLREARAAGRLSGRRAPKT